MSSDLYRKRYCIHACAILFALVLSGMAHARTADGWNLFRIWRVYGGHTASQASSCVIESYGSVVNNCAYPVGLTFNLTVDAFASSKSAIVTEPAAGFVGSFKCFLNAFDTLSATYLSSPPMTFTGSGPFQQSATVSGPSKENIGYISIYCDSMPPGSGIATIYWSQ